MGPPRKLTGAGGADYELDDGLVAVHGPLPDDVRGHEVATFGDEEITILRASEDLHGAAEAGPVYRAGPQAPVVAPTGRVFVRYREGTSAEAREPELARAGFTVESVPGYAPHAAWVRPRSGRVADALQSLERLRSLPDVEHVEPQLLAEASLRA